MSIVIPQEVLSKAVIRRRLAEGWHAWVAPGGRTLWARLSDRGLGFGAPTLRLEREEMAPDELEVLDEVLQEDV